MSTSAILEQRPTEVTAWMFFRSLKASRLIHPDDVQILERRAQEEPLENIISTLTSEGLLNDYQLKRLCDAEPHGLLLGQYRILGELGEGGCGKVYKAKHSLMGRTVALKVIGSELVKNKHAHDIFLREVVACTRLNHPNIATAYDANEHDGQLYFVMEFVPGRTLQNHVVEQGPLTFAFACSVALETAFALQHAHEQGLVHRDIKPANIILIERDKDDGSSTSSTSLLKVVDFGLARIAYLNSQILETIPCHAGGLIGTPAYIAPEQIRDSHSADIRSDLYSLGCTLYFVLTGRLPFNGINPEITLHQHLEEQAEPMTRHRPSIPPVLARIVERLMAKNPSERFQTPNELISALQNFVLSGDLNALAPAPMSMPAQTPPPLSVDKLTALQSSGLEPIALTVVAPALETEPSPPAIEPLWHEWRMLLDALQASSVPSTSDAGYKSLYRKLMASLRAEESESSFAAMANLVEPWVMLATLRKLDAKTLNDLIQRAEILTANVWPDSGDSRPKSRFGLILVIGLVLAAIPLAIRFIR